MGQEEDEIGLSHVYMFLVRDPSFPCRCRGGEYRIWMVATFHNENSSFFEFLHHSQATILEGAVSYHNPYPKLP